MPWTLYRYILRELIKVLVLTTAVMVVVLSFLSAIGPLSDGLLGPITLLKFVMYTMPTVLGFALPFAGAFSATVVFHAMAKDNEVLACRAGGLSYGQIFAPVAGLGLVLMVVLLLLSNTVVPRFWRAATKTVQGDVLGVLVSQLNQNHPYKFGHEGLVLYADKAEQRDPPEGSGAQGLKAEQLLVLEGVAVGRYDPQSERVIDDTTASRASALLVRDPFGKSYITLRLVDPVHFEAVSDEVQRQGSFDEVQTDRPILLPNPITDEAVFFSLQQLLELKRRPQDFDTVRDAMGDLSATVLREMLLHLIDKGLTSGTDGAGFVKLKGGLEDTFYRLSAPTVEPTENGLTLRGSASFPVTVDLYNNEQLLGQPVRRFESNNAKLAVTTGEFDLQPEAELVMTNVTVLALNDSGAATRKSEYAFPAMRYSQEVLGIDPSGMSAEDLNAWSMKQARSDAPTVLRAREMLRYNIIQLKYMIDAELYTRFASALATPLLLMLGGLLAVRLRDRLPLAVFFWSFMLAVITLIMIKTGGSMAERYTLEQFAQGAKTDRLIGVGVLWGGNLMLLLVCARLYLKIARN